MLSILLDNSFIELPGSNLKIWEKQGLLTTRIIPKQGNTNESQCVASRVSRKFEGKSKNTTSLCLIAPHEIYNGFIELLELNQTFGEKQGLF